MTPNIPAAINGPTNNEYEEIINSEYIGAIKLGKTTLCVNTPL